MESNIYNIFTATERLSMVQHRVHFGLALAEERLSHHPRYGDSDLQQPALNGKVFFAGTETARQHGGASIFSGDGKEGIV